jgi:hypothetical protein
MNYINSLLTILRNGKQYQQQRSISRNVQLRTILIVAAVLSMIVVYQCGLLIDADALTRYYNCTTRAANKNGTLSLQNVDNCYDNVFKGAKAAEKELEALSLVQQPNNHPQ